jgi:hypothetical protein
MNSAKLIEYLIEQTRLHINRVALFQTLPLETLQFRPRENAWNVLECIAHLNLYADFYIPEFERKINESNIQPEPEFNSTWFGNFCAKSMLPKEKLNKMSTFKNKNPIHLHVDVEELEKFVHQHICMIEILNASKKTSLNKVKISTTLSNFIHLRLGDAFQFVINHNSRHIHQAEKVLKISGVELK